VCVCVCDTHVCACAADMVGLTRPSSELAKKFGLRTRRPHTTAFNMGIWDNDARRFSLQTTRWRLVDMLKFFAAFGVRDMLAMRAKVRGAVAQWNRLYDLQAANASFSSVRAASAAAQPPISPLRLPLPLSPAIPSRV
jgi:hypothetical protein